MRRIKNIVVITGCLLLIAVSTVWAFGEIRYPDRPLNLRKGRSARTAWVGSLTPGQKVKVAFLKNGWVAVFEPNETRNSESAAVGYSNVKYLLKKQTRVEPKTWGELVYPWRTLNIRNAPSVKGKKVGSLKAMEHVKIDFPDDNWTMVFSPRATIRSEMNAIGYSSAKYFKPATKSSMAKAGLGTRPKNVEKKSPVPLVVSEAVKVEDGQGQVAGAVVPPPVQIKSSGSWGTVVTLKKKVNIRTARTSGARYVRTMNPGEKIRVDFLKNGWYAVFGENEKVRKESRALGYALQSLVDGSGKTAVLETEKKAKSVASPVVPAAIAPTKAKSAPSSVKTSASGQKTMVIDRSKFAKTKRADPTPDKTAHGYQYRIVEKAETRRLGETWITIKVFLATKKLPDSAALKDFSTTLWRKNKKANKNLAVLVYLPGMDLEDISFGVIKFDDEKMQEFWVRRATLFGTDFL